MGNSQKDFIIPALLALIVLLVIGGGVYIYKSKRAGVAVVTTKTQQPTSFTFPKTDWDPSVRFSSIPKESIDEETKGLMFSRSKPCSIQEIDLLLSKIKKAGPTVAEFDANKTIEGLRGFIAFGNLVEGCSSSGYPETIKYLNTILNSQTSTEIEIVAVGTTLASFGQPEATKVIIDWSRNYTGEVGELIYKRLVIVRDESSADILLTTARQQRSYILPFANNKNRDALAQAAKDWCGARSDNLQPKGCTELSSL